MTTVENTAAEIVDAITASPLECKLNKAITVANIIRERLSIVHPNLKQRCGCLAIWPQDRITPHNICPNCQGQCGGVRIML